MNHVEREEQMKKYSDDFGFMNYEYLRNEIYLLRRTRQIYLLLTVFTSTVFIGLMFFMARFNRFSTIAIFIFLIITGYALVVLWIYLILFLFRHDSQFFPLIEDPDQLKEEIEHLKHIIYRIYKRNQRFFLLLCINWLLLIALSLFFFIVPRF